MERRAEHKRPKRMNQGEIRGRRGKKRISAGCMDGILMVIMAMTLILSVLMAVVGAN